MSGEIAEGLRLVATLDLRLWQIVALSLMVSLTAVAPGGQGVGEQRGDLGAQLLESRAQGGAHALVGEQHLAPEPAQARAASPSRPQAER